MIKVSHPALALALVVVLVGIAPTDGFAEDVPTAAELDWVRRSELSAADAALLPIACEGTYVAPQFGDDSADHRVRATATLSEYVINQQTILSGDVIIEQGSRRLTAPLITLDSNQELAKATGPLVIREQGMVMTGDSGVTNLVDGTGVIDNASFLLHESGLRGSAEHIERLANADLRLDHGQFTRCEPSSEFWILRGREILLKQEAGYGVARNVTVRVENVPIFWFPYFRFPIDDQRHSGFLMPGLGSDGAGGIDIALPYYFNLAPEYDVTYTPRSLWRRGLIHEGQARLLAGTTAQEINLGYIARDAIYDPSHIVDGTSAALAPVPERQNRWFLNLRHNGGWESRIKTAATYSAVSDRDYPGDIGGDIGSSSYDQAISPVESSLSDPRSAMLQRRAEVQYRGDVWNTAVTVQEFQNLHPDADEEYATLPRLSADRRGTLGPASLDVSLEYASFDRENDGLTGTDRIVGDRSVADVALSWRRSAAWGFFQPGLGVVYRQYGLRDTVVGSQTNPAETTSRLSLDTGLYFDRYFQTGAHLLHQTLEPRLFYLHVEADDQQDLPLFDSGVLTPGFRRLFRHNRFNGNDRIGDANQVSLGITTRYLDSTNGAQLLEASVGQTYYFADRTVIFPGSTGEDATARESPLFAELRLRLASGLSLASTIEWNAAAGNTNRSTLSLKYNAGYRKLLNLNYLYATASGGSTMASVSESDINFIWPIRGNWSATGQWNFSWDRDQTVQSLYGVEYNDCCWKARVILRRFLKEPRETTYLTDDLSSQTGYTAMTGIVTPAETGIFVELQLKGLAMLGRRVDVLLERVIPGYREREDKVGR